MLKKTIAVHVKVLVGINIAHILASENGMSRR